MAELAGGLPLQADPPPVYRSSQQLETMLAVGRVVAVAFWLGGATGQLLSWEAAGCVQQSGRTVGWPPQLGSTAGWVQAAQDRCPGSLVP